MTLKANCPTLTQAHFTMTWPRFLPLLGSKNLVACPRSLFFQDKNIIDISRVITEEAKLFIYPSL